MKKKSPTPIFRKEKIYSAADVYKLVIKVAQNQKKFCYREYQEMNDFYKRMRELERKVRNLSNEIGWWFESKKESP